MSAWTIIGLIIWCVAGTAVALWIGAYFRRAGTDPPAPAYRYYRFNCKNCTQRLVVTVCAGTELDATCSKCGYRQRGDPDAR